MHYNDNYVLRSDTIYEIDEPILPLSHRNSAGIRSFGRVGACLRMTNSYIRIFTDGVPRPHFSTTLALVSAAISTVFVISLCSTVSRATKKAYQGNGMNPRAVSCSNNEDACFSNMGVLVRPNIDNVMDTGSSVTHTISRNPANTQTERHTSAGSLVKPLSTAMRNGHLHANHRRGNHTHENDLAEDIKGSVGHDVPHIRRNFSVSATGEQGPEALRSQSSVQQPEEKTDRRKNSHVYHYHGSPVHKRSVSSHIRIHFNETAFVGLPKTKVLEINELSAFKVLGSKSMYVRPMAFEDACYCTQRRKFIVLRDPKDRQTEFPDDILRSGAVLSVPWTRPDRALATPRQKVVHINGTTVMWRGRPIHYYTPHLQKSLLPIRSVLDILKKARGNDNFKVAAESFRPADNKHAVRRAHDYYLGDVSEEDRIELSNLRPRLVCFKRVIHLGSEHEGHSASPESFEHIKELIEKREGTGMKSTLSRTCKAVGEGKNTIWILERQREHGSAGRVSNTASVKKVIQKELARAGMAHKVNVKVIQSPSMRCPKSTDREGCFDTTCSNAGVRGKEGRIRSCIRHPDILSEALAFNKITFLVTTLGPGNEGMMYMARGSQAIEVIPHGVLEQSNNRIAKDAGVVHYEMHNSAEKRRELELSRRFGDVASSSQSCWDDLECREFRRRQATFIDVHHLRVLLREAIPAWKLNCGQ